MLKRIYFPVLIFLIWYFIILVFQIFIQPIYLPTSSSETLLQRLFTSWVTYWDAAHYLSIGTKGYHFPQQAFFPLWPILIKIGTFLNLTGEVCSFLLTIILGISNFILFYLLAKKLVSETKARWSLIFFASYPAAIFLHAGYSENLFLFSTFLSFLFLENKKYFLSSLAGAFATASRIAGGALVTSYIFIKTNIKKRILMGLIGSLGLICYMIFLYLNYSDPFYFIKGQMEWCKNAGRCGFVFPLLPIVNYAGALLSGKESISFLSFRFNDWASSTIFLSLLILVWKKLPKHYFVYSLAILLMPLSTGTTTSMLRVTLTAFPVFFILPDLLKRKWIKIIICLLLTLLELRTVALFTGYMWVA